MLDSTMKYASRLQSPKSLCSLMTQKDKLLIKLKMKLPKLLVPHHMVESQMTGSSFLQHTRLISLSRMWDLWGGHFLIFLALVAAVVFIMMLPFEIFTHTHTHTNKCFWWWREIYPKSLCKWNITSIRNNSSKIIHLPSSNQILQSSSNPYVTMEERSS